MQLMMRNVTAYLSIRLEMQKCVWIDIHLLCMSYDETDIIIIYLGELNNYLISNCVGI